MIIATQIRVSAGIFPEQMVRSRSNCCTCVQPHVDLQLHEINLNVHEGDATIINLKSYKMPCTSLIVLRIFNSWVFTAAEDVDTHIGCLRLCINFCCVVNVCRSGSEKNVHVCEFCM